MGEVGNYREIQKEDLHNVHYVSNPDDYRRREGRIGGKGDDGPAHQRLDRLGDLLEQGPNVTVEMEDEAMVIRISGAVKTALSSAVAAAFVAFNI